MKTHNKEWASLCWMRRITDFLKKRSLIFILCNIKFEVLLTLAPTNYRRRKVKSYKKGGLDWPVFILSSGFLIAFIVISFINSDAVDQAISVLFDYSANLFGAYWQILLLLNFLIGLVLAVSKYGKVRLGKQDKPKYSYFGWVSMILVTLQIGRASCREWVTIVV